MMTSNHKRFHLIPFVPIDNVTFHSGYPLEFDTEESAYRQGLAYCQSFGVRVSVFDTWTQKYVILEFRHPRCGLDTYDTIPKKYQNAIGGFDLSLWGS